MYLNALSTSVLDTCSILPNFGIHVKAGCCLCNSRNCQNG
ncbi:hypothetical protein HMPREF1574_00007 [Gardnerella pickettii JCP7659]|nr:hypothetical protein HMPREF1574_00007 [Gardnerella pickettii JCP7659]